MHKRLDNIFAALMLALGMAAVLTGYYCLHHSIAQAQSAGPAATVRRVPAEPAPEPEAELALAVEPSPAPQYIYDPAIPLSPPLQEALRQACAEADVPVALALGLIEAESCFEPYADNGQCYGLCQLNRDYFPDKLSPEDNLRAGIAYLGRLLEQYGDIEVALTCYNAGHDTGSRIFAGAVLAAAEAWAGADGGGAP